MSAVFTAVSVLAILWWALLTACGLYVASYHPLKDWVDVITNRNWLLSFGAAIIGTVHLIWG